MFDQTQQRYVLLAVIAFAIYWFFMRREGFEGEKRDDDGMNVPSVSKQDDIPIGVPYFVPSTKTIMSGSGFIPEPQIMPAWGMDSDIEYDNGAAMSHTLANGYSLCSPSCCSPQYPTPFHVPDDEFTSMNKEGWVPNNYQCNNSFQGKGCLCMDKSSADFMINRGGNA